MEHLFSTETIALITVALLIVGFSKFIIYYKSFGIPIIDYIDPSEIITLFADNIATASIITLILAVPYFGPILLYNASAISTGLNLLGRLNNYFNLLIPLISVSVFFLLVCLIIVWRRPKIYNYEIVRYVWAWTVIVIFIPLMSLEIGANVESKFFEQYVIAGALVLSFSFLILLATWNEIQKVKAGYFSKTEVHFEDSTIKSTPTNFYIGKTKSYLFFYCIEDKSATVYSTAKLKSIKYAPQQ